MGLIIGTGHNNQTTPQSNDYNDLNNKPSINSVTLSGNKSAADLGLQEELTAGEGISIVNDEIGVDFNTVASITRVNELSGDVTELASEVGGKLDAPSDAGTAGQVLTLDDDLNPVWDDPQGGGGDTSDIQDVAASALCKLKEDISTLKRGLVDTGNVIVHEELAAIYNHVQSMIDVTEDIIASAFCALDEAKAVIVSVADPYRGYLTYTVGDVVSHEGKVWQCNTDVTSPEIFDRSKWTQTSIANVIANL